MVDTTDTRPKADIKKTNNGKNIVTHGTLSISADGKPRLNSQLLTPEFTGKIDDYLKTVSKDTSGSGYEFKDNPELFMLMDEKQKPIYLALGNFSQANDSLAIRLVSKFDEKDNPYPVLTGLFDASFSLPPEQSHRDHVTMAIADAVATVPQKLRDKHEKDVANAERALSTYKAITSDAGHVVFRGSAWRYSKEEKYNAGFFGAPYYDNILDKGIEKQLNAHPELFKDCNDTNKYQLLVVTDTNLDYTPQRLFVARYDRDSNTHVTTVKLLRTLNLDAKANPTQSIEALDNVKEIQMSDDEAQNGKGMTKVGDALIELIKSGKLVKADDKSLDPIAAAHAQYLAGAGKDGLGTAPMKPVNPADRVVGKV